MFFFFWETKKVVAGRVRQVVVLYSNDCVGICLCGLSIGCLGRVASYRGGRLNRFDCIYKASVNTTTNKYYYGICKNTFKERCTNNSITVSWLLVTEYIFLIWYIMYIIYNIYNISLSNSNHFTSAKKCRRESCIIDFMSAKMEFASAIFKNCIFPIIQLKGVANRLSLFQNLSNQTNRSSMG